MGVEALLTAGMNASLLGRITIQVVIDNIRELI
jgi:hypothetical protein